MRKKRSHSEPVPCSLAAHTAYPQPECSAIAIRLVETSRRVDMAPRDRVMAEADPPLRRTFAGLGPPIPLRR